MLYVPSELRLKIDANFGGAAPPYILALEGLSIVAALRELSWKLTVTFGESCLHASELAATLIEVLCPMAITAHLLPPGAAWRSHATLRLYSKTRMDEEEARDIVLIELHVHDDQLALSHERLCSFSRRERATLTDAYEGEAAILRELDGFAGESAALLEKLRVHMEYGARLARAQLAYITTYRAEMGLRCLYTENPNVRRRIDKFATWLLRLQGHDGILEESLISSSRGVPYARRIH